MSEYNLEKYFRIMDTAQLNYANQYKRLSKNDKRASYIVVYYSLVALDAVFGSYSHFFVGIHAGEDVNCKELRRHHTIYRQKTSSMYGAAFHPNVWNSSAFFCRGNAQSSCQAGPVSQNEIRQGKHHIQFCCLFSQPSVPCFSVSELSLY